MRLHSSIWLHWQDISSNVYRTMRGTSNEAFHQTSSAHSCNHWSRRATWSRRVTPKGWTISKRTEQATEFVARSAISSVQPGRALAKTISGTRVRSRNSLHWANSIFLFLLDHHSQCLWAAICAWAVHYFIEWQMSQRNIQHTRKKCTKNPMQSEHDAERRKTIGWVPPMTV